MNSDLVEKIRDVCGILQRLKKEIASIDVPGLELVREDLGIKYPKRRHKKNSSIVFGQKHGSYKKNPKVTMPSDGQGDFPQSEVPMRSGPEGSRP